MKYLIICFTISMVWIIIEIYRAPMMDEITGRIIRPGKKLSDIFRRKKEIKQ